MKAEHLHRLLMDLVRTAEFALLEEVFPGRALSMSQLFALHELDHRPA
jgi:hypothetical protein